MLMQHELVVAEHQRIDPAHLIEQNIKKKIRDERIVVFVKSLLYEILVVVMVIDIQIVDISVALFVVLVKVLHMNFKLIQIFRWR